MLSRSALRHPGKSAFVRCASLVCAVGGTLLMSAPASAAGTDLVYNYNGASYTFLDYTYMGVPGRLYVPPGYNASTPTPLVLFLHGLGEQINNSDISKATNVNTGQINGNMTNLMKNAKDQNFLLFCPQSAYSAWWSELHKTVLAIGKLSTQYNVDPNRIYVTGLSAGGGATVEALRNYPDLFAAYVSLSTAGGLSSITDAAAAAHRPAWYYVGYNDGFTANCRNSINYTLQAENGASTPLPPYPGNVTYTYISPDGTQRASAAGHLRYTQYANAGHDNSVWNNGAYNDPDMYTWMLGQSSAGTPYAVTPLSGDRTVRVSCVFWNAARPPQGIRDSRNELWNIPGPSTYPNGQLVVFTPFAHDTTGQRSTVSFELTKMFSDAATTTLPAGAPYDTSVAGAYWPVNKGNTGQIAIHGLTPGGLYNLVLFASIGTSVTGDYVGKYSVGAQSITIDATNNTSLGTLSNLVADATGSLTLDVTTGSPSSTRAVLNTMSVSLVPEPTSAVVLLGMGGLLGLRRRRD